MYNIDFEKSQFWLKSVANHALFSVQIRSLKNVPVQLQKMWCPVCDKTWRFLTWTGDFDLVLDVFFDDDKLKFQVTLNSVMFEGVKKPPEEWWHSSGVEEDIEVPDRGWGPWSCFLCVPLMTISLSFKFHKYKSCLKLSRTLLKRQFSLMTNFTYLAQNLVTNLMV